MDGSWRSEPLNHCKITPRYCQYRIMTYSACLKPSLYIAANVPSQERQSLVDLVSPSSHASFDVSNKSLPTPI